jgi:protein involved in polysaccharide export with SLBB domain
MAIGSARAASAQENLLARQPESAHVSNSTMTVREPGDPEVVRAERGIINPGTPAVIPLEEPINPDLYTCGRGDTFELNFWGQQNFRLRVSVDMEGRTFISKVGYVEIVGKSLSEARRIIKKAVARFYPGLNFDLSLVSPRTFLLHVIGYVSNPGLITANPLERVGTVLPRAGSNNGSHRRIEIKHRNGKTEIADLVMYDLTGDSKYNPFVTDGDVITVPFPELTASISGPVRRAGRYELIATKDLAELFTLADGFTTSLTRTLALRIVRRDKQEHEVEISLPFPAGRGLPNAPLTENDRVFVPSSDELQQSIIIVGPVAGASAADEVTATRRITYFGGATVRSVIERTGGVGASADLKSAYLRHYNGSITPVDLNALLVLRDFSADKPVSVADTIVIPQKRLSVLVEGAVMRPGPYPYNPRFNINEYVGIAGGANRNAQTFSNYRVVSPTGVTKKASQTPKLDAGDTLVVPERAFSRGEVVQLVIGGVGLALSAVTVAIIVARY